MRVAGVRPDPAGVLRSSGWARSPAGLPLDEQAGSFFTSYFPRSGRSPVCSYAIAPDKGETAIRDGVIIVVESAAE